MSFFDGLEYKVTKQHDKFGRYMGELYEAHVEFKKGFMITVEAELRGLSKMVFKEHDKKVKSELKQMIMKAAVQLAQEVDI